MDTAVWWMEYAIRHKGAEILHSTLHEDSPWYQYHHVDVAAFVLAVVSAICGAVALSCHLCYNFLCRRSKIKSE